MVQQLYHRFSGRLRWELREWRTPSRASFVQEELDRAVLEEIEWRAGERILDVGCAQGHYMEALATRGADVLGVDLNEASLSRAAAAGWRVSRASALRLPFASGAFDAVFCHKTLYLLTPPETAAQELARVVRRGGRLVFSGSNTASPYARVQAAVLKRAVNGNWSVGNRWSIGDWCRAFGRAGMRVRAIYSCNLCWPLVYRAFDWWIIPNEWMRRYARWVRRATGMPLRTGHAHGAAMDYVVEMVKV